MHIAPPYITWGLIWDSKNKKEGIPEFNLLHWDIKIRRKKEIPIQIKNCEQGTKIKKDFSSIICTEKIQRFHHQKSQLKILGRKNFAGKSAY